MTDKGGAEMEEINWEKNENKENLEEMFQNLEAVIKEMEEGDVTLEHSFDLYNKGMTLLKNATRRSMKWKKSPCSGRRWRDA